MRRWVQSVRFAVAGLIAGASLVGAAAAAEVIIVLDGSGSSAGQIGGIAKIDIVRGALRSVLLDAPDDLAIGLVAYGHRQEENCGDIELIAPPGPTGAFLTAANSVRSVGRSPIAEATAAAAAAISDPDTATIIVITDNADNCSDAPCATISAIHDEMPGLTISVLGIAIPSDEVTAISCFTEITGGLYLRADNAAGFQANLDRALTAALVDPLPPLPTATIAFPGIVTQGRPFEVTYQGPRAAGDQIRIAWLGSPQGQYIAAGFVDAEGAPVALTAPAEIGALELRYWHAERNAILARVPLQIAAVAPRLTAPETVQIGGDIVVIWEAEIVGGREIHLAEIFAPVDRPMITAPVIRSIPTVTIPAPGKTGTYEIRLVDATIEAGEALPDSREVRILARTEVNVVEADVQLEPAGPILAGNDFVVAWAGPGGGGDEIRLARPEMAPDEFLATAPPMGTSIHFRAPVSAGAYELRYYSAVLGEVIATVAIDVEMPAATLTLPEAVAGGMTFEAAWTGPAAPGDRIALMRSTMDGGQVIEAVRVSPFGRPAVFEAPVTDGTYAVAYLAAGGDLVLALEQIVVSPATATIDAPAAAEAGQPITVNWTGPEGRYDEIRIVGADDGNVVAAVRLQSGRPAELAAPEEAGRYRVVYWAGSAGVAIAEATIDIRCRDCALETPVNPAEELRLGP